MKHAPWRSTGRRILYAAFVLTSACSTALWADEPPAETAAPAPQQPAANVTKSLRVKAPSVTVRANPSTPQTTHHGSGQYAFLDENGQLTNTPPADFEFPVVETRAAGPIEIRSATDPNVTGFDVSHIRAVMRAHVDAQGKTTVECLHSTDAALKQECTHSHDAAAAPTTAKPSDTTAKEDGQ